MSSAMAEYFGLQSGLKPVVERVEHLKNEADAVECHDQNSQALSSVHNADNADNRQRRQQAGSRPQQQRRTDRLAFLLRVIHQVLDDHAVDAERAERGEKGRVCRRIINQAVIAWAEVARRKNTNDKGQQLVRYLAADDPAGIFTTLFFLSV